MSSRVPSDLTVSDQGFSRVLVTGATGFIGSHLVSSLQENGCEVHVIVRRDSVTSRIQSLGDGTLHVHVHDGTMQNVLEIVSSSKAEVVFHLASNFVAEHRPQDIPALVDSNIAFGCWVLEAMQQNGVKCLVNSSTSWQHSKTTRYDPVNLYAAMKQAFEDILAFYTAAHGFRAISLVLFDTYGPRDPRPKLINALIASAREGTALELSLGEQLIDLVYVEDVVRAYMRAAVLLSANKVDGHERYAVSSGEPISIRALVGAFENILGRTLPVEWGARPYRSREAMVPNYRAPVLPGWQPVVRLREGLKRTLEASGIL